MAIGSAVERNHTVYVYDEKGRVLFSRAGSLLGYTATTVTVKHGSSAATYDQKGSVKFTRSA